MDVKNRGFLPGRLKVKRRAPDLLKFLQDNDRTKEPEDVFDWVSLYALAVNEENAAGGRVVTAPHQRRRWSRARCHALFLRNTLRTRQRTG